MTIDAEGKPEFTFGLEGGRDPVMDIEDVLEYVSDSLWEISSGDSAITDENLNKAIGLTLSRASPSYESVWELLPIRHRQALIALANLSPDDKLFSGAVVQKYGLASAPTFRKALKRLVEKGLADRNQHKYSITDVFFKKWIQMNFAVK